MKGQALSIMSTAWKQIREAAGVSFILFRIMVPFRLLCALLLGFILSTAYSLGGNNFGNTD